MITRRTVKNKCIIFCYYITKSQSHNSNLWVKWTNNGFVLVMCRTQWSNQSVQTSAISFVGKSIISPQYVHYTECWFKMLHSTSHIQHVWSEVQGSRPRGRQKRTCTQVLKKDCQARKLNKEDAMDHMEEVDKGCLMTRTGVSGWMFLLVPAHPDGPGQRAAVACNQLLTKLQHAIIQFRTCDT